MWAELGLSWREVGLVLVAAGGIYAAVIVWTRVIGLRSFAEMSAFDFAVTIATGAIIGRVAVVRTTLLAGVMALGVLFVLQHLIAIGRLRLGLGRLVDNRPILLFADGRLIEENLRAASVTEEDVHERIRLRGFTKLTDVGVVVLERTGAMSVLPYDPEMDGTLLEGVGGRRSG